jgi:PAS domain S-box-containing protein
MSAEAWESELLAISGESASTLIRSLLDGAPDAMVVIDDRGRVLCFNLLAERMFGYTRDEVLGRSVELLVPERLRGVHQQHRAMFARAPSSRPMDAGGELHGARKDGSEFSIEISLSPIRTAGGLLTSASIRDISARLQREEQLRRTQARLLNAVESIQGACAIFDERDELVLCNSSYRLLFGPHMTAPLEGQRADELITRGVQN